MQLSFFLLSHFSCQTVPASLVPPTIVNQQFSKLFTEVFHPWNQAPINQYGAVDNYPLLNYKYHIYQIAMESG